MDTNYVLGPNGELYHWGIKGMKWGVRRYQNKDGSLTPAGKKRYDKLEAEMEKLGGKSKEKKLAEMTDEEVAAKTARMRLENNLDDEMRRKAANEQQMRKLQESIDQTSTEDLRNQIARLELEERYKNLKNPNKPEPKKRDREMERLQEEVDRMALEKRHRDLYRELHPKRDSFLSSIGKKALNEVLVPTAMNAGKSYLEKLMKKMMGEKEPDLEALLKKWGDMSEEQANRLKNAAARKGWADTLVGKKKKDKQG